MPSIKSAPKSLRFTLVISLFFFSLVAAKLAAVEIKGDRVSELHFYSEVLGREKTIGVVAPQVRQEAPVLVFLHGRGRHHRSLLERPACRDALLMANHWTLLPDGEDGWYVNSPEIPEELVEPLLQLDPLQ